VGYALGKHLGGAVERNRLRRRLKAIIATMEGGIPPGDYLFSARSEAIGLQSGELRKAMAKVLDAASAWQSGRSGEERS